MTRRSRSQSYGFDFDRRFPSIIATRILQLLLVDMLGPEIDDLYDDCYNIKLIPGTMYGTLNRMAEIGWVTKTRDTKRKSCKWYSLTREGKSAAWKAAEGFAAAAKGRANSKRKMKLVV